MAPTIPLHRTVKARVEVLRRGEWIDVSRFVTRVEVNHGDHSGVGVNPSGADGVARTATITLKNGMTARRFWPSTLSRLSDDLLGMSDQRIAWSTDSAERILEWLFGAPAAGWTRENLAPRDKTSRVNLVEDRGNLVYDPLIWPNREIRVWGRTLSGLTPQEAVALAGDGSTAEFDLPHTLIEPATVRLVADVTMPVDWEIDGWTGKLWLNRPLNVGESLTIDYSTYTQDDGWRCEFHGLIGGDIRADGHAVRLQVVDLSKRLQEAYIFDAAEEPYSGPMEEVMQQILRDHPSTEHITLYFPSGTPANPRPSNESPEWYVEKYAPGEMSVWDALGRLAARRGWFIGYRWHEPTQQMQLQLLAPPRWKDATTADLRLSWMTDFYGHDLADSDASIINYVEVIWRDEDGNEHTTVRENPASIGAYGLRAGRIREDDTSEIRDEAAARRLADAVIADLSEMRGASSLDMPVIPGLEVFTGIALDDPRVSSSEDFLGIENVLQIYDFENGRFRSQVSGPNRVVGGLTRWLGMIARPGAKEPTPPEGIGGGTVTMPTPTITVTEMTEGLIVEVPEPPVYPARWAATQVQVSTDPGFPAAGTLEAMDKSTRFSFDGLDGGETYYVRAAYIDINGRRSEFSSHASGVPKRIQDALPADLFDPVVSSDPMPSSGSLDNLRDKDPSTGCTFPSAPTITYKYPAVQGSDIVELHLGAPAQGYIQMRHPDSGAWIDVYGSETTPASFTQGWNRPRFEGDKLYYGREYRIVLLDNVRVNELWFERTVAADLVIAGRLRATGDLTIEAGNNAVRIDGDGVWGYSGSTKRAGFGTDGRWIAGGGAIEADESGLRGKKGNDVTFEITSNGDAFFGGQIAAESVLSNSSLLNALTDFDHVELLTSVSPSSMNWHNMPGMSLQTRTTRSTVLFIIIDTGIVGQAYQGYWERGDDGYWYFVEKWAEAQVRLLINGSVRFTSPWLAQPAPQFFITEVGAGTHNLQVQWRYDAFGADRNVYSQRRGIYVIKFGR